MRDMSEAKEVVRRLRLAISIPELPTVDFHLLEPAMQAYDETKNPFAISTKQAEMISTVYNRYFEA